MWLRAHEILVRHVDQDVPSGFKAAHVLATSMDLQLIKIQKSTARLTSKKLEQTVEKELAGGQIMTEDVAGPELAHYSVRRPVWGWIKQHPYWSFWLFILTADLSWRPMTFLAGGGGGIFAHPPVMAMHLGSVIALAVGSTKKNRFFFVFVVTTVGTIIWALGLFIPWIN